MIRVFFDGACKYCSREIRYYKSKSSDELFEWIDVAENPNAMVDYNITQADALLFLHAVDEQDNIYIGARAFALIWKNLPGWKLLGYIIELPIVKIIIHYAYVAFAKQRFKRYAHCQLASKNLIKNKTHPNLTN